MVVLALVAAVLWIPLPLLVMEPGPTTDVAKLIQIDSPTFHSKGSFLLTTALVSSTRGVTLPDAARAIIDPDRALVPREAIFPSNSTRANTDRVYAAEMTESQQAAAVAALHELGIATSPEGAFVRQVQPGAPAAGRLLPGDVIVAVEGSTVTDPQSLLGILRARGAPGARRGGRQVKVTVRRSGALREVEVRTVGKPPRLGVLVTPERKLPFKISIDAGDIGGPSAGLMFGLAIYDALTPGDLTGGRRVAGTGSLSNLGGRYGAVRAVGAVAEKVSAAGRRGVDLFLVPKANLKEARSAAPEGLKVVPVSTLHQAIQELHR